MKQKDWTEEILKLYNEGYSMKNAVSLVLKMIEDYRGLKNEVRIIHSINKG